MTNALTYAPRPAESIMSGGHLLRRAFLSAPRRNADRDNVLVACDQRDPPALLIHRGVAYRCSTLPDGRRAIIDILLPGDIAGADYAVFGHATHDIVAAKEMGFRTLSGEALRELMRNPDVALRVLALVSEARARTDRHLIALARSDARERLAALILDVYERLRRRELITRPTFNLPLTQELVADYCGLTMVHVSRTLRRLREERIVIVDRQVVMILDVDALREVASGLAPTPETTRRSYATPADC